MGRRDYRPWSYEEEDRLEGWVAQHLDLTWPERAEEYSKMICPRSSESLRSKLRQVKQNIRRHRVMEVKAVSRRPQAALVPSRSGPCPRYITRPQTYAGLYELPSAKDCPAGRNTLSVNETAASSPPDKFRSVKKPGSYSRIDISPQSTSEARIPIHVPAVILTIQCCPRETSLVIPARPETDPQHKPLVAQSLQPSWPSETSQ